MPITIDFTDVGSGFEPIPEGTYNAVVFDAVVRESRTSGKPYINWEFKIQGGDFDGRRLWNMTSLQPQALWRLKQMLARLGVPEESMTGEFNLDFDDVIGSPCRLVVGIEEYQGSERNRVVDVLAPDEDAGDDGAPKQQSLFANIR